MSIYMLLAVLAVALIILGFVTNLAVLSLAGGIVLVVGFLAFARRSQATKLR